MDRTFVLVLPALLAGCSQPAPDTHPAMWHPANPDAPVAAAPETPSTAAPATPQHAAHMDLYQCPMHPDVTSNDPNERCPKCGMKINQKIVVEAPR